MRSVDSNILFSGKSVSWKRNTVDLWNRSHFVCSGEVKYSETQTRNGTLQDIFFYTEWGKQSTTITQIKLPQQRSTLPSYANTLWPTITASLESNGFHHQSQENLKWKTFNMDILNWDDHRHLTQNVGRY